MKATFLPPIATATGKIHSKSNYYVQRRGNGYCTVFIPKWEHKPTPAQAEVRKLIQITNRRVHHIMHTPSLREDYERRYREAKQSGQTDKGRLCDYVYSEEFKAAKAAAAEEKEGAQTTNAQSPSEK